MAGQFDDAVDTVVEHAQADALAGLAGKTGRDAPEGACRNCGTELTGEYCHGCGQSARSLRRPFWALLKESAETLLAMDGRFMQTVPALMLHPGRVSRDYLDGRRSRFIPPFRLYIFASLIFFVLLPLATGQGIGFAPQEAGIATAREQVELARETGQMSEEEYQDALEGLEIVDGMLRGQFPGMTQRAREDAASGEGEAGEASEPRAAQPDWMAALPAETRAALQEAGEPAAGDWSNFSFDQRNMDRLGAETRRWVPRIMFVLLPLYAALLALVYLWRRSFLFFDHLIVSLHFHAALFFAMTLTVLAAMVIGWGWAILGLLIYANAYLYRINRVVYERGRFSSAVRTLTLDVLYFFFLMLGLLMAVIFGAMSLGS